MSGWEKKNNMICLMPKPSQSYFVYCKQSKEKIFTEKTLRKKGSGGFNKRWKGFLTALTAAIKKDPTMSIREHTNELKVHEKTEDRN